ncbi:CoA-transferase family III domain-containing protein [Mycena floridula]|nr:CoA-transferase family III domain-containing protein [Mycena floridula]
MSSDCKGPARKLWLSAGLPEDALEHLHLSKDPDPVLNSSFRLGTAAQTAIGLAALSAAHLHRLRTGLMQDVSVEARHAVLEFHSEAWYSISNEAPKKVWDTIAGLYQTRNFRGWVRIHTNFPHHRKGILDLLNVADSAQLVKEQVQAALLQWDSVLFETEAASRGLCATALRSFEDWDDLQGDAFVGVLPVEIRKVGEAPPRIPISGNRPLDGTRVLDLSRVLAGPVAGRNLAAHGADVLLVTSPKLPALPALDLDTSRGKRTTQLDLTIPHDKHVLEELVTGTDVFLQAYRPGGLASKGFSVDDVTRMKPGIVYASLTAWGWQGNWKERKGFDSLVQTATGFNVAEGRAFSLYDKSDDTRPRPFPVQALDHAAGYLLAFGINTALCKTIADGGSYEVRVSLAAVGQWVRSLGRLDAETGFTGRPLPSKDDPEILSLLKLWTESETPTPRSMSAISHAGILSKTPVREGRDSVAPMGLNKNAPKW